MTAALESSPRLLAEPGAFLGATQSALCVPSQNTPFLVCLQPQK